MTGIFYYLFITVLMKADGLLVENSPSLDTVNILQGQVRALNASVAALMSRVVQLEKENNMIPIAFLAELGQTLKAPPVGSSVIFDVVHLNDGNAYKDQNGIFTAPVAGLYHFTLELSSPGQGIAGHWLHVNLMRSSETVGYIYLDGSSPFWLKRSATATLHLSSGDVVWVKVTLSAGKGAIAGGNYHSIFSGFLIKSVKVIQNI